MSGFISPSGFYPGFEPEYFDPDTGEQVPEPDPDGVYDVFTPIVLPEFLGVEQIATICDYILVLTTKGQWLYSDVPTTIEQPTFQLIPGLELLDNQLRFVGRIPLLVDGEWVSAGLLNSVKGGIDAVAIYRDPETDAISTRRWSNRFPEGEPAIDAMPRANVAASWGSFLLLGDIVWKEAPGAAFSSDNQAHYPHAIWFSEPGQSEWWDPIDVVFIGQKLADNRILGMFPIDAGLVVITTSSVSILRGTPTDFVYEELRTGISPRHSTEATYWPYAGLVCWMDRRGRVWGTNGQAVERLDRDISIPRGEQGVVWGVDESLFVSGGNDVRVMRSFEETAAWTRLIVPKGWKGAINCRSLLVAVGADQGTGDFVLDSEEFGVLDQNALQGSPDLIQVYDLAAQSGRGVFFGQVLRPVIQTAPLPGSTDKTTFWHRFGVSSNGPGSLRAARSYPSANTTGEPYEILRNDPLGVGQDKMVVFPAHGPSREAVFEFEFQGDVTPEQVMVAFHRGRGER